MEAEGADKTLVLLVKPAEEISVALVPTEDATADVPIGFRSVSRQRIRVARVCMRHDGLSAAASALSITVNERFGAKREVLITCLDHPQ